MSPQYGELRPTSGWDRSGSFGHPNKFQRVSRLGSITAGHSSSGRQSNFAALNRGCHLYSAGRPSRWALAHISGYWQHSAQRNVPVFKLLRGRFRGLPPRRDDALHRRGEIWRGASLTHAKFHPIGATIMVEDPKTEIFTEIWSKCKI